MQNPPCLVLIRSSDVTKAEANVAALEVLWLRDLMPFYIASYNTCHIWFLCERRKFFVGPAYNRFAYFADVSTGTSGDIRATTDFNEGLVLNHAYLLYVTNYIYRERSVFSFLQNAFFKLDDPRLYSLIFRSWRWPSCGLRTNASHTRFDSKTEREMWY